MKKSVFFVACLLCGLFISCGESARKNAPVYSDVAYAVSEDNVSYESEVAVSSMKKSANNVFSDMDAVSELEENMEAPASGVERKLIKNGYVTISVPNFDEIENQIQKYAKMYGGYITNTYLSEYNYSAEIKIPSVNFENAMNNAGTLGEVKNRSQNANDVTDEFYDLDSRINTKKILKNKLEGYLKQASSMKELLEVERQLNSVISELESMEGRMKRLSNQIDYSTININAVLPTGYSDTGYEWPNLKEKFSQLGVNVVNFFAGFLLFLMYLIIYGIPILVAGAFLFWLLFGKVGLLRKLFNKLKK